jgi:hypothetical protein
MKSIRKPDDFKKKSELYTADWSNPSFIKLGEFDVPIPTMPPREEMENYGLPRRQQRFRRTVVPRAIRMWDKRMEREFVESEWHKRRNGVWYLINGKPIYLTGAAYVFFNYWYTEKDERPTFRMEAVEWFLFMDMCWWDEHCFGASFWKGRRIGETEKALFYGWERITRYRSSHFGMQHTTDNDAYGNFSRVVNGANKMIYFFSPERKGSSDPKELLEYKYPPEIFTKKKMEGRDDNQFQMRAEDLIRPGLNSRVSYEATKFKRYDGKALVYYYLDEPWKILKEMPVIRQVGVIKQAMAVENGTRIVGLMCLTSTVEEINPGQGEGTIEVSMKFWSMCDPDARNANGRTTSGLYRMFRSAELSGPIDRFGFHKKKETREAIMNARNDLLKKGFLEEYADLCRRQPLTIEDCFMLPASDCRLMPGLLDRRIREINSSELINGDPYYSPSAMYDLVWKGGIFGGEVEAILNPNGRWEISQHPSRPNFTRIEDGKIIPGNRAAYEGGADTVDHTKPSGKASKQSLVIHRKYDEVVDGHLEKDPATGEILDEEVYKMETDQFVCCYVHRSVDPYEGYEDMLKTLIYYGCRVHPETNKPGFLNWLVRLKDGKYTRFIRMRPLSTLQGVRGSSRAAANKPGTPATTSTINLYTDGLIHYVKRRVNCTHLLTVLKDFRQFNVKNRTKRDITVAAGYALLSSYDDIGQIHEDRKNAWDHIPYPTMN